MVSCVQEDKLLGGAVDDVTFVQTGCFYIPKGIAHLWIIITVTSLKPNDENQLRTTSRLSVDRQLITPLSLYG
jgi:hypothetical protein